MQVFADTVDGYMTIVTSGGNGNKGQDGANGIPGADRSSSKVLKGLC